MKLGTCLGWKCLLLIIKFIRGLLLLVDFAVLIPFPAHFATFTFGCYATPEDKSEQNMTSIDFH